MKQLRYIYIDEFSDWIEPKWYRHPIEAWKWHRLLRKIKKNTKVFTWKN